jgi:two-component system chemotaxis response regulator CheB
MPTVPDPNPIRVLIVDDSAIVRRVLADILANEAGIEVVGTAPDPYIARDKILALAPDVLTLDIEMPRMDGLSFLDRLMKHRPLPVIVISSLTQSASSAALEALRRGAVDVLAKPGGPYSVGDLKEDLPRRIRAAASARLRRAAPPLEPARAAESPAAVTHGKWKVVAIGASTGGTQAIEAVLTRLPAAAPPIVVAQHIPAGFSNAFARRLDGVCAVRVREAADGDLLEPGLALIAPGNFHLSVERSGGALRAAVRNGEKVCYQRPSVDVLFDSVARAAGSGACGVLLTGMGADGAEGLLHMREAGADTLAQDEASCIVFGMPREAILRNAAAHVESLDRIGGWLAARMGAQPAATISASLDAARPNGLERA